jgi:sulfur-oxidizing protein SoxZ
MAEPMKIRATLQGDVADVRVLMAHPMETGQRKDAAGKLVPLHFIQTITAQLNGKTVFAADVSQAVSRNPVFAFKVKGAKAGDKLFITWQDNTGDKRTDEVVIRAAP